ncbi:hypothetical protein SERLA73DRAFT_177717 [Serpula lacrymans var. lacrymans S7.3]|uniref:Uncharacterized protein n=2 Tax=Serpula lacrymans var. lacrymans TaxID=341189 RepID=F8PPE3_SERL3|nr:uncharacterized protein SERLADRAFT_461459 [Serpula lacrymans var. lacrymans S7.9]EGO02020.1 hypothetical protein SERLA73DRAFT_177717 [Serpula lacrymans var. lacrymans S7.3]EGO27643.1 hypothetical protein SERLADRAFT_461459 [Serpula lacrymans var. lacrymans S7.9]
MVYEEARYPSFAAKRLTWTALTCSIRAILTCSMKNEHHPSILCCETLTLVTAQS